VIPTSHRIFPRTLDDQTLSEPPLVSIGVSEVTLA